MALTEEVVAADSIEGQIDYYHQRQFFPLVCELISATNAIENALWRQEQDIEALAKAWLAIEEAGA